MKEGVEITWVLAGGIGLFRKGEALYLGVPIPHYFGKVRALAVVGRVVACPTIYPLSTFGAVCRHIWCCVIGVSSSVQHDRIPSKRIKVRFIASKVTNHFSLRPSYFVFDMIKGLTDSTLEIPLAFRSSVVQTTDNKWYGFFWRESVKSIASLDLRCNWWLEFPDFFTRNCLVTALEMVVAATLKIFAGSTTTIGRIWVLTSFL